MSRAIIRPGYSSAYDVDAMKFASRTYVDSRLQGYKENETVPPREEVEAGRPMHFQYDEHVGWYSVGFGRFWHGEYLTATALIPDQFSFTLRKTVLNRHTDCLIYKYIEESMKLALAYAEERNSDSIRRDVNLSFARNRIIVWICDELQEIAAARTNDELLRRLAQLHYFLSRCTIRANVNNFFPESSKDEGANGFPAKLNLVKRKVEKMQQVITSAMEMQSLGEMFERFGASLSTAVSDLSVFSLYFISDKIIRRVHGRAGTTFSFDDFYRYNVSNGSAVGTQTTDIGSYEPALANSVLGWLSIHFHEQMQRASRQQPFENRFLKAASDGRAASFADMAAYILDKPVEDLPSTTYVWKEFYRRRFFPIVDDGDRINGHELPVDFIRFQGLLLETQKIACQLIKAKSTATFMGDYNMVYNAHMHWGLQSLLTQYSAVRTELGKLMDKMSTVRSAIVGGRPKAGTAFHENSHVMVSQMTGALSALDRGVADVRRITHRLEQLRDEGYLQRQCKEAKAFVDNASKSAKSLYDAGVISEEQFRHIERYKPVTELQATTAMIRDPLQDHSASFDGAGVPVAEVVAETQAPEKPSEDPQDMQADIISSAIVPAVSQFMGQVISSSVQAFTPSASAPMAASVDLEVCYGQCDAVRAHERELVRDQALFEAHFEQGKRNVVRACQTYYQSMLARNSQNIPGLFALLSAAFNAGLASEYPDDLKDPLVAADHVVQVVPGGLALINIASPRATRISFSYRDLLNYFGSAEELRSANIEAMLGRYAMQANKERLLHDEAMAGRDVRVLAVDDISLVRLQDRQAFLRTLRHQMWQDLVAVEQSLDRTEELLTAIDAVDVLPSRDSMELVADWNAVNDLTDPVPGHKLLSSRICNVTALLRETEAMLGSVIRMRSMQYEQACKSWHIGVVSKHSYEVLVAALTERINACRTRLSVYRDLDSDEETNITIGDIKQFKIQSYQPIRIEPIAAPRPVTHVFGKHFNVAMVDRAGQCDQSARFASPLTPSVSAALDEGGKRIANAIFDSRAFRNLANRITSNQRSYAKYFDHYMVKDNHNKANYLIIGAGKAAVMQAYTNELMIRLKNALGSTPANADAAWRSVYHLLGGEQGRVNLSNKADKIAFLRSDDLTFKVRLIMPTGEFSRTDREMDCATHRHGSHAGLNASNVWGMRGNASLPATSSLLVDFVKLARAELDKHLRQHHVRMASAHS